jgi:hypothetical protein
MAAVDTKEFDDAETTVENQCSQALMNGTLVPETETSFEKMLLHNQSTWGKYFKRRDQYELFMMLPINDQQRDSLLRELCGSSYRDK